MRNYEFTTKSDLVSWCREVPKDSCYASTGKFLEGLTEHVKLSHAIQWLFRNRSFTALEDRVKEILGLTELSDFNTYNWGAKCYNDMQGFDFEYKGTDYCAIQIHYEGDIRGNYSDLVVFEGSFLDNASDFSADSMDIEVDGKHYSATPSLTGEMVSVWGRDTGIDFETCEVDRDDIIEAIREHEKAGAA